MVTKRVGLRRQDDHGDYPTPDHASKSHGENGCPYEAHVGQ